jgi:hypothetical protein
MRQKPKSHALCTQISKMAQNTTASARYCKATTKEWADHTQQLFLRVLTILGHSLVRSKLMFFRVFFGTPNCVRQEICRKAYSERGSA